jgi:hypothetical protein
VIETKRLTRGLLHPAAVAFLVAGVLLAVALVTVPALAGLASRAGLVVLVGALAYITAAAVVAWPDRRQDHPALRDLRAIRRTMAARVEAFTNESSNNAPSPLAPVLTNAMHRLDRDILPTCESIVRQHSELGEQFAAYKTRRLPSPDNATLLRLQEIYRRQEKALVACVQQAANADAALLALTQESDDERVVRDTDQWARGLVNTLDALAAMLHADDDGLLHAKG